MATLYNNMDRSWSFIAKDWQASFMLKPREIRMLSTEELKAVKSNDGVKQMLDKGLLMLNHSKEPVMVDTVSETMQQGQKNMEKDLGTPRPIPETNIAVKTEIKGSDSLTIPQNA